jgi:N-acetylglutamate synthase-like GNAT family acetyltransferase
LTPQPAYILPQGKIDDRRPESQIIEYEKTMIRQCEDSEFETIYAIINDAAQVYRGVIPADCWEEPYMSRDKLQHELDAGVVFWGYEEGGDLVGVMGIQHVQDVTLIRHAYVRLSKQNQGIGSKLLSTLRTLTTRPTLVGTWADAAWAIHFYEKHGFRLVSSQEKDRLLRTYWSISERQVETSVVLADERWFDASQIFGRAASLPPQGT